MGSNTPMKQIEQFLPTCSACHQSAPSAPPAQPASCRGRRPQKPPPRPPVRPGAEPHRHGQQQQQPEQRPAAAAPRRRGPGQRRVLPRPLQPAPLAGRPAGAARTPGCLKALRGQRKGGWLPRLPPPVPLPGRRCAAPPAQPGPLYPPSPAPRQRLPRQRQCRPAAPARRPGWPAGLQPRRPCAWQGLPAAAARWQSARPAPRRRRPLLPR